MIQIGNVPEINKIKGRLDLCKEKGLVMDWELPFEHILTRLSAAVFFMTLHEGVEPDAVGREFQDYPRFSCVESTESALSDLKYKVMFDSLI